MKSNTARKTFCFVKSFCFAKIGLAKQLQQLICNVLKKYILKFLWKHAWQRHTLIQVYSLQPGLLLNKIHQIYFPATYMNYSQLLYCPWDNCNQLSVKLPRLFCSKTSSINSIVLLNVIICDAYHCQYVLIDQCISFWSFWYWISFPFP